MNAPSKELTMEELHGRIIADLRAAEISTRPSKQACHALLSSIYLIRGEYGKAEEHTGAALDIGSDLVDYNSLSESSSVPFPNSIQGGNPEVIF